MSDIRKAAEFLNGIGIPVTFQEGVTGFLPGVRIVAGGLHADPEAPVSNLLHEAGHLACLPGNFRHLASDDISDLLGELCDRFMGACEDIDHPFIRALLQCSDPEATAWAWAAGKFLGIPGGQVIVRSQYDGTGDEIRAMLEARAYLGINGLRAAGMCRHGSFVRPPAYPEMLVWVQPEFDLGAFPEDVIRGMAGWAGRGASGMAANENRESAGPAPF